MTAIFILINKLNKHIDSGELELIPWLNFKIPYDDEKLYRLFNIPVETQNYIRNFLPDYYKIR